MGYTVSSSGSGFSAYGALDQRGRRKYLTRAERKRFRAALEGLEPSRQAFCLVLYHTGCRISEALNLRRESLKMDEGIIVVETLKRRERGHFRAVPVKREVIRQALSIAPKEEAAKVWGMSRSTAYRLVKAVMREAGITGPHACPKGLRHSYGVAHVGKMVSIDRIAQWLGHTKLETTAIYLAVTGEEERALAKRLWDSERD